MVYLVIKIIKIYSQHSFDFSVMHSFDSCDFLKKIILKFVQISAILGKRNLLFILFSMLDSQGFFYPLITQFL